MPRLPVRRLGLSLLFVLGAASGASAEPYGHPGYPAYAASGYGYAGNLIDGTYLGAPFTRVPSPSRLVPPAWGYGTYGVPTVAGVRDAPVARPALYVIERQGQVRQANAVDRLQPRRSAKLVSRTRDGRWTDTGGQTVDAAAAERSGAQVVSVRVPAR